MQETISKQKARGFTHAKFPGTFTEQHVWGTVLKKLCKVGAVLPSSNTFVDTVVCQNPRKNLSDLQAKQLLASTEHFPIAGTPAFVVQGNTLCCERKNIPVDN